MSQHHALIKNDPRWKAARAAVLERDGYACLVCGSEEDLEVDHIEPLAQVLAAGDLALAFDPDNLQTLCRPCHTAKGLETTTTVRNEWINPEYLETLRAIL